MNPEAQQVQHEQSGTGGKDSKQTLVPVDRLNNRAENTRRECSAAPRARAHRAHACSAVHMTTNTLLEAVEEIYSRQQVQIFSMFERVYVNVCAAQRKAHSGPRAHRCTLKPLIGPAARATVSSAVRLLAGLLL